jgi:hypothetical protein
VDTRSKVIWTAIFITIVIMAAVGLFNGRLAHLGYSGLGFLLGFLIAATLVRRGRAEA